MNQDKMKLMQILKNLERDYNDGLISEEKYIYLSNQYRHKIDTIDTSNRIRTMQGKKKVSPRPYSRYEDANYQKSRDEDERLVEKYIHNPESYNINSRGKKTKSGGTSPWYIALAVIFLLFAFGAGISFGIFSENTNSDVGDIITASATINDTAFPEVKQTYKYNRTSNYTKYSSNSYSSDYSSGSSYNSYNSYGGSGYSSGSSGYSSGSSGYSSGGSGYSSGGSSYSSGGSGYSSGGSGSVSID